ncbi:MAG: hypothetical protein KKC66_04290 [Candidatus Omnitrophica bacterium]|nr:hypothetical protein [Candidatus Omnitrophota bacterium]MBU1933100.1 hypothetical protein [Candidatus Omnitrophota bacterium]
MKLKIQLIVCTIIVSAFIFIEAQVQAQEARKVSLAGRKILVSEELLPYLGALTFIVPQEAEHPRPKVHGMAKSADLSRINGYNHSLEGEPVGSGAAIGGLPGIATNAREKELSVHRVVVTGDPVPIKDEIDYIDIPVLVDYLKEQADITITQDTVYKGGNIGTKEDPKIVVVNGSRLKLMHDFEGYGILILTGERTDNPRWDDESEEDDIDAEKSTLYQVIRKIGDELDLDFPREQRVKRRLRLVMEDTSSWYGMIISDIGSETLIETDIDREINVHERRINDLKKGRRNDSEDERKLRDRWEREERESPSRQRESSNRSFRELFARLFDVQLAYAEDKDDDKAKEEKDKKEKKHFIVYPKKEIKYHKPVWHRHGAKGVVMILGRQHGYWHPPYPWPVIEEDMVPDSPRYKWIHKLKSSSMDYWNKWRDFMSRPAYAKNDKDEDEDKDKDKDKEKEGKSEKKVPRRSEAKPGDGVRVYGAMLIGGERPMVIMKLADVFYSKEAIDMVDKKLSSLRFTWSEYKEEE